MADMTYTEFLHHRDIWESKGNRLMSREDVARFDRFFANREESAQYRSEGFSRAQVGDFSQFETVEPMVKAYLGAKKCYDLYDRYKGNASDPALQQELKNRLMEADLRTGFAFGGKDPADSFGAFLKDCERIANRQMMIQTLEDPDPSAKLRLLNQFKQENPNTAQQQLNAALNKDLEQRVEMAKMLFMNHLGKFQTLNRQNQPIDMSENMAEIYTHGGRTMFILPAGANQSQVMTGIQGREPAQSGLARRWFATHSATPRTLHADGTIAAEAQELKVGKLRSFAPRRHKGMDVSVGGLGQLGPNGRMISSDGTNGHMYMHLVSGDKNTCGMMLVGFENSAPGKNGRLGHAHDASAKKAGSSTFLSDKSYLGKETGGRVVDLSGLPADRLGALLSGFEAAYRNAAKAAQNGNPELLDSCNNLLTGKVMSLGQMKGMLQGLQLPQEQIQSVEAARAGHPATADYKPIAPTEHPPIPMKLEANALKKPFRVTQCNGLAQPVPPDVMKKPGLWAKLMHRITFRSKNSYVSKYKEYQRTLPDRMEAYRRDMEDYRSTLDALERGENPRGLKASYDLAVREAEAALGISAKQPVAPRTQATAASSQPKAVSSQMKEHLENTLLDALVKDSGSANSSTNNLENFKAALRGRIRSTQSYNRLLRSGDDNISRVLSDPAVTQNVLASISQEILGNTNQRQVQHHPNAPQKRNAPEVSKPENAPKVLGG